MSSAKPVAACPPSRDLRPSWVKATQPFAIGGLAGCLATTCIQPIDMVKVRIQLLGDGGSMSSKDGVKLSKNPFVVAKTIVKNEGLFSLYKGLDAGLIRQITYTTARLGIFRVTSDFLKKRHVEGVEKGRKSAKSGVGAAEAAEPRSNSEVNLPLYKKAAAALFAGGCAALIGNPADLALIRLQTDSTLPISQRRNYTGVINVLTRIVKDEKVLALWRGSVPTLLRAMSLNLGMLASYDQAKEFLDKRSGDGLRSKLLASAISGFFAVTFSLPFDFMKTRIQKMQPDPQTGKMPYKNIYDCAIKVFKREGPLAFYSGYPTYYVRIAPHAMITLVTADYMNSIIQKFYRS